MTQRPDEQAAKDNAAKPQNEGSAGVDKQKATTAPTTPGQAEGDDDTSPPASGSPSG